MPFEGGDHSIVEIIKGSASSLYGGSALGGVINLVSRRPKDEFEGEALVNFTTRDGQDFTTYMATPFSDSVSGSVTAGAHHQSEKDLDNDGWADLAGYERYTVRPRIFWEGDEGERLYFTTGYMTENRQGGTVGDATVGTGENAVSFIRGLESERIDSGLVFEKPLGDTLTLNSRFSAMSQEHTHQFGNELSGVESDQHESYLAETSLAGYTEKSDWLVGIAYQSNIYDSDTFESFDYSYEVPGIFTQVDYQISDEFTTSASARLDDHSEYGTQFSPRVSFLYRPGDVTIRGSYGEGYFAPTPFVEEIEAAGLSRLLPIDGLQEEQAQTASLDVTYRFDDIETSLTLFGSNVDNVTRLETVETSDGTPPTNVRLVNA